MKYISKLLLVMLVTALLVFLTPTRAIAENQDTKATEVVVSRESYYIVANTYISDGGSSERSPSYHDLVVSSNSNTVTFRNLATIHDERIQNTEYYVMFYVSVYEIVDDGATHVKTEYTGYEQYSPPNQIVHYQNVTFDVDIDGSEYHDYEITTIYDWFILDGDDKKDLRTSHYPQMARVYEDSDLIDDATGSA